MDMAEMFQSSAAPVTIFLYLEGQCKEGFRLRLVNEDYLGLVPVPLMGLVRSKAHNLASFRADEASLKKIVGLELESKSCWYELGMQEREPRLS